MLQFVCMNGWMDVIPNRYGLSEFIIQRINLSDFLRLETLLEHNKKIDFICFFILVLIKQIRWLTILLRSRLFRVLLDEKIIDFIKKIIQYKKPIRD